MKHLLILDAPGTPYFSEYVDGTAKIAGFGSIRYVQGADCASAADLSEADVVVVCHGNRFGSTQIAQLKGCRGIVVATAGIDHVDVAAANQRSIPVCNIPDYGSEDVADHAILLMLACLRRLPAMLTATRAGGWDWSVAHGAKRLRGRTLGIVGLGRIGRAMADRALAFGMRIVYYDPYVDDRERQDLEKLANLDELMRRSDVLSIHCPLTSETAAMINADALAQLRPGGVLINTARGGIVDQQALLCELHSARLGAVGLDVLANEPEIPDALRHHERVLLTPHAAFYSVEGLQRMKDLSLQAARDFADGKASDNAIVTPVDAHQPERAFRRTAFVRNPLITDDILRYAKLVASRNLVCNTFGSVAALNHDPHTGRAVVYTKHMGISLEEMGPENVVAVDLESDELLYGSVRPSIGHQMNREIFRCRPDIGAVVHLHPDEVIAYFSILHSEGDQYISNDTALVMQGPVEILAPDINIELDLVPLRKIIHRTNCIVMPQHGITTLGETLSEAYHRACSIVAETRRLLYARMLAGSVGMAMPYVSEAGVQHMFEIGRKVIYGNAGPRLQSAKAERGERSAAPC